MGDRKPDARTDEINNPMPAASNAAELYQQTTRAALIGLVVNILLGAVKLVGGIVGNSFALIADAVNSIGDVVATCVVLFALRVAQTPADSEHPYGHTRAEAIAATNIAVLIMCSAGLVAWEAVRRLGVVHSIPPAWTLWIAASNVVIKEGLYQYKVRVGRRTGSSAIIANAWDHRSDALCALAVLFGLGVVRFGGPTFVWADEMASLVVVVAIIISAISLFRSAASELMDLQASDEYVQQVRRCAEEMSGVMQVETLWIRKSGLEFFVDIHIQVRAELSVAEGHAIGHLVKDQLIETFPAIRDVLVHLEPFPHSHRSSSH